MREVFADTYYWIALLHDRDQGHAAAQAASQQLQSATLITTDEVLTEFLAHFSDHGPYLRRAAADFVDGILANPDVLVRPQSRHSFLDGLALFKARPDKGYSLTDCISMQAMRQEGIGEVLTGDVHFAQEGFTILF